MITGFAETFLALFAAHLMADFALQPNRMYARKRQFGMLIAHVAVVSTVSFVCLGNVHLPILLTVFVSHLAMDALKVYALGDHLGAFVSDQLVHIGVLVALALAFPSAAADGWWGALPETALTWWHAGLSVVAGAVACILAGGVLVQKVTERFTDEIGDHAIAGLTNGGMYIGWLERALILLLVLTHQTWGVGFLVAAKSILRFGEVNNAGQRKVAEYIIIGTFLSFGWGVMVAGLTAAAVRHWLG